MSAVLTRVALFALVAAAVGGVVRLASMGGIGVLGRDVVMHGSTLRETTGELMRLRLSQGIEAFRLTQGHYPETLAQLLVVGAALGLEERSLSFPFQTHYAYRRVRLADGSDSYVLALPLR
jgi:hypothetical protein